ncbi:hypothetical protein LCI18_002109 [Fusarium solani-melongenae]|uniref:Uncharacterized protein n=1 Tax=Fusarium solani subsp. cucurbitae TaxID=2747967 RepID=A0ACD3YQB0_FUSSC|nr:hypothetical protein LCI18_002109 [Fusarium solani-melongenae]
MSLCNVCKHLIPVFIGPRDWIRTSPRSYHGTSLESFCASLEAGCPVCFCVWRHIRSSPYDKPSKPALDGFESWPERVVYYPERDQYLVILRVLSKRIRESGIRQSITLSLWRTSNRKYSQVEAKAPIEGNPLSEPAIRRVRSWLHDCEITHPRCQERKKKLDELLRRAASPRLLLYLGGSSSETWSIVETNQDSKYSEYIALSHRWTPSTLVLLQDNVIDFKRRDSTKTVENSTGSRRDACQVATPQCVYLDGVLPKDYQTVIQLCRKLSVRYLWVDSLCIIQGPDGDFRKEAPKMMDVYRNALLTFSICWAFPEDTASNERITPVIARSIPRPEEDSRVMNTWSVASLLLAIVDLLMAVARGLQDSGELVLLASVVLLVSFPDSLIYVCLVLVWYFPFPNQGFYLNRGPYPNPDLSHAFVNHDEEFSKCTSEASINQRGWVFQERVLSQRILYLGNDQLYWECDHLTASEDDPSAYGRDGCRESIHTESLETSEVSSSTMCGLHASTWLRMMEDYSSKALTYDKDRLVAISGLARLRSLLTQEQYITGIWINYWHLDLTWYPAKPRSVRPWPSHRYVHENTPPASLPPWSWASFPSAIMWGTADDRGIFETKKINTFELVPVIPVAHLRGMSVTQEFNYFDGASLDIGCLRIPATLGSKIKRQGQCLKLTSVEHAIPLYRVTSYRCTVVGREMRSAGLSSNKKHLAVA